MHPFGRPRSLSRLPLAKEATAVVSYVPCFCLLLVYTRAFLISKQPLCERLCTLGGYSVAAAFLPGVSKHQDGRLRDVRKYSNTGSSATMRMKK